MTHSYEWHFRAQELKARKSSLRSQAVALQEEAKELDTLIKIALANAELLRDKENPLPKEEPLVHVCN